MQIAKIPTKFPQNQVFRGYFVSGSVSAVNPLRSVEQLVSFQTNEGEATILKELMVNTERGGVLQDDEYFVFRIVANNQLLGEFNSLNLDYTRFSNIYENRKYKLNLGKFLLPSNSSVRIYFKPFFLNNIPTKINFFFACQGIRNNEGSY